MIEQRSPRGERTRRGFDSPGRRLSVPITPGRPPPLPGNPGPIPGRRRIIPGRMRNPALRERVFRGVIRGPSAVSTFSGGVIGGGFVFEAFLRCGAGNHEVTKTATKNYWAETQKVTLNFSCGSDLRQVHQERQGHQGKREKISSWRPWRTWRTWRDPDS